MKYFGPLALVLLLANPLRADSNENGAEQLNEQGKALFKQERYYEASKRFRMAIELNDDPRYYFNLCMTLRVLEQYEQAMSECQAARGRASGSPLAEKIDEVIAALEEHVPASAAPAAPPSPPPASPEPGVISAEALPAPESARQFGFGVEAGVLGNLSVGRVGQNQYHPFGALTRINLEYDQDIGAVRPGGRVFFGYALLGGKGQATDLRFMEYGASGSLRFLIGPRLGIAPYLGIAISSIDTGGEQDVSAFAIHGGLFASFEFATHQAFTARLNLNQYNDMTGGFMAEDAFGLDSSRTLDLTFGYSLWL